jgi:hypothetical protein
VIARDGKTSDYWSQKRAFAREILNESFLYREATPDLSEDRTRFDLMYFKGKLGMRGPTKSNNEWDFDFFEDFSYENLNPKLAAFIKDFPCFLFAKYFDAASIRFRFDNLGTYGVWIDTKRELLENFAKAEECADLQKRCTLELGQRGDLISPRPNTWLPSFSKDNQEIPLKSYISSFSQPGPEANRALIACGMELLEEVQSDCKNWCELGAGYGNLTAAFGTLLNAPRWILEKEKRETTLWEQNKSHFGKNIERTEFCSQSAESLKNPEDFDLLIADPPRSGFSETFAKDILKARNILLFNCDLKGLIKDSTALKENYELKKWSLIDLFPGTAYAEAVSLWQRK